MKTKKRTPEENPGRFSNSNITENVKPSKLDYSEITPEEFAEAFLVALRENDELTQAKIANEIFESI